MAEQNTVEATWTVAELSKYPAKPDKKGVVQYEYQVRLVGPGLPQDAVWLRCPVNGLQPGRTYRANVQFWDWQGKRYYRTTGEVVPEALALPPGQPQPAPNPPAQPQPAAQPAPAPQPAPEVKNFLPGEYVSAACSVARDVVAELPGADPSTVNTVLITLYRDHSIIDRVLCRRAAGKEGA